LPISFAGSRVGFSRRVKVLIPGDSACFEVDSSSEDRGDSIRIGMKRRRAYEIANEKTRFGRGMMDV